VILHISLLFGECVVQAGCDQLSTTINEKLTSLKQRVDQYHVGVDVTRLSAAVSALEHTGHDLAERYIAPLCLFMMLK